MFSVRSTLTRRTHQFRTRQTVPQPSPGENLEFPDWKVDRGWHCGQWVRLQPAADFFGSEILSSVTNLKQDKWKVNTRVAHLIPSKLHKKNDKWSLAPDISQNQKYFITANTFLSSSDGNWVPPLLLRGDGQECQQCVLSTWQQYPPHPEVVNQIKAKTMSRV